MKGQLLVVSGQLSVVSCQWSVVSCQLSVVSGQLSVVSGQFRHTFECRKLNQKQAWENNYEKRIRESAGLSNL